MKDPIEREDAIEVVSLSCRTCLARNAEDCEKCSIPKLRELINAISSADRPQGEWIDIGTISHSYKCSVCGRTLFHITVGKNHVAKYYPYCHCGARMKRSE